MLNQQNNEKIEENEIKSISKSTNKSDNQLMSPRFATEEKISNNSEITVTKIKDQTELKILDKKIANTNTNSEIKCDKVEFTVNAKTVKVTYHNQREDLEEKNSKKNYSFLGLMNDIIDLIRCTYFPSPNENHNQKYCKAKGYEVLDTIVNKASSYYGRAYINHDSKTIVICHRSYYSLDFSQTLKSIIDKINKLDLSSLKHIYCALKPDIIYTTPLSLFNLIASQAQIALNFTRSIYNSKNFQEEYSFYQTGHGTGGAIAELVYALSGSLYCTVAFDSTGALEILKEFYSLDTITNNKRKIFHIMSGVNATNTYLQHIKSDSSPDFYEIVFDKQHIDIGEISIKEYLKVSFILPILMFFHPIISTKKVKDWPVGFSAGLKYFYSEQNNGIWEISLSKHVLKKLSANNDDTSRNEIIKKVFKIFSNYFFKNTSLVSSSENNLDKKEPDIWKYIAFANLNDLLALRILENKTSSKCKKIYNKFDQICKFCQSSFVTMTIYNKIDENLLEQFVNDAINDNHNQSFGTINLNFKQSFSSVFESPSKLLYVKTFYILSDANFSLNSWVDSYEKFMKDPTLHNDVVKSYLNNVSVDDYYIN